MSDIRRELHDMPAMLAPFLAGRTVREVRILLQDYARNLIAGLPRHRRAARPRLPGPLNFCRPEGRPCHPS
jgi:hypothetical protein